MSAMRRRPSQQETDPPAAADPTGGDADETPPATAPAATSTAALAFDHVTFAYQRQAVLCDVTLRVACGETVAVVGANGSGKTTLIKVALGLLQPARGTVRLFGTAVTRFADWPRIGYVPQRAGPDAAVPVSVQEVVRSGLARQVGPLGRLSRAQRDTVDHVMEVMGVAGLRRQSVRTLSGGQQQRALIARALVTEPDLLVLDEPTSAVDAEARHTLRESLEHLRHHEQVAMVYISHDPHGFAGLADRVVEMQAGHLCDAGAGAGETAPAQNAALGHEPRGGPAHAG
jgi:zinc transport system ATP-binding protein